MQLREKSSSSRLRSAFTFSNSSRSILAWVTSGSERPCPTSIASSDELVGLGGLLGHSVHGALEDVPLPT